LKAWIRRSVNGQEASIEDYSVEAESKRLEEFRESRRKKRSSRKPTIVFKKEGSTKERFNAEREDETEEGPTEKVSIEVPVENEDSQDTEVRMSGDIESDDNGHGSDTTEVSGDVVGQSD